MKPLVQRLKSSRKFLFELMAFSSEVLVLSFNSIVFKFPVYQLFYKVRRNSILPDCHYVHQTVNVPQEVSYFRKKFPSFHVCQIPVKLHILNCDHVLRNQINSTVCLQSWRRKNTCVSLLICVELCWNSSKKKLHLEQQSLRASTARCKQHQ